MALPPGTVAVGSATLYGSLQPGVLVDQGGTVHVAFIQRREVPSIQYSLHYTRRTAGAGAFEAEREIVGPWGSDRSFSTPEIIEDPGGGRLILIVGVFEPSVGVGGREGVWAAVSTNGGATWGTPAIIFDDFYAQGSVALRPTDRALGLVPGLTGVGRLIVPPGLTLQTKASFITGSDYVLQLSDRISSRAEVDQAFDTDGRSYTMFESTTAGWVHVGGTASTNGSDRGQPLDMPVGTGWVNLSLAGGPRGVGILETPQFGGGPLTFHRLSSAGADAGVNVPNSPGSARAVFPALDAGPDGAFLASWVSDVGLVSRRSDDGGATWSGLHTLVKKADGLPPAESPLAIGGSGSSVGAIAWTDVDSSQAVVLPFDAKATDPPPTPGSPPPPPGAAPPRRAQPACAGLKGAKRTTCLLAHRRAGCRKLRGAKRAACLHRVARSACLTKKGRARARCLAKLTPPRKPVRRR